MKKTTLFQLSSVGGHLFDGSTSGIAVTAARNVRFLPDDIGLRIDQGAIELARNAKLDQLESFTIEATIVPDAIAGGRRNIIESQNPPVALFIQPDGRLTGSVRTKDGWITVDSGTTRIAEGEEIRVALLRHPNGKVELHANQRAVGTANIAGPLVSPGNEGFKIGAGIDPSRYQFVGTIKDVAINEGVTPAVNLSDLQTRAHTIAQQFQRKTNISRVRVSLIPDEGRARLQPIRDLLNAVGVTRVSDLSDYKLTAPITISPGTAIVAPLKQTEPEILWRDIAKNIGGLSVEDKRNTIAKVLTNRNSASVLKEAFKEASEPKPVEDPKRIVSKIVPEILSPILLKEGSITSSGRIAGLSTALNTGTRLPVELRKENPTLRRELDTVALPQVIQDIQAKLIPLEETLTVLDKVNPALWPSTEQMQMRSFPLTTIPVDTAIIVANKLDLTNARMVIEPEVTKLYIIAEELICGPNAQITWRRPGGATPPRADNADLNGRGWSGVHTRDGSRDGLHGEDGRPGQRGIDGARGHDAPELEIWAKRLTAVPNIDLNGEDGRQGGRGQRGGHGGRGADGETGLWMWFFGSHCISRPGHGGHGGDGGNGGTGGRGGDGGAGGRLTIGVLQDSLADAVKAQAFGIKNQGGQRGLGGPGGAGGNGGAGGRAGIGEVCKDALNGKTGSRGQPGSQGALGVNAGFDGEVEFFEFSNEAWDEMLSRPWISQLVPSEVFPGDTVTLRGSRFVSGDRVKLGSLTLTPTINADESLSITIPMSITGGVHPIVVRRPDGTESNRLNVGVKPRLATLPTVLLPNTEIEVAGNAFVNGATALVNGESVETIEVTQTSMKFKLPGSGGSGTTGGTVSVQVRNPDGRVSNSRTASVPRMLEIPFRYSEHNLTFRNFSDGVPDWGTFTDTFGAAEIWHELLNPVFGHPVLTMAYYGFYHYFLKGTANGGLATGFCTSLASLVADKFWRGDTDSTVITKGSVHKFLTAIHGRLLSRESLIHFHDQGREGVPRVERSAREIESIFLRGCDRDNAPLLFFIPAGAAWDAGYFDELGSSHCVMPYRFVYPPGHPGPILSHDGRTTISSLDGVEMYVWDCNAPENPNCRLVFKVIDGMLHFDYFIGTTRQSFSSQSGVTLGMMTNGKYLHSDHDLPFSGPFGLRRFIVDFLLSPADLQVTDGLGLRTGNFGGQILSEIPGSLPAYLVPGMYLYPADTPLTRHIVGNGNGQYTFNTVTPDGASVVIENVETAPGQEDTLAMNGDGTQIRFAPGKSKTFNVAISRMVDDQARAIAISGVAAAPGEEVDITLSPDLSLIRFGNRGVARDINVQAFSMKQEVNVPVNKQFDGVRLPSRHDLLIAVPDWDRLDMTVDTISFE